nr:alpha/beta hydrolase [Bacillus subtilis]
MLGHASERNSGWGAQIILPDCRCRQQNDFLLHGIPTNSFLWMNVIPQLAKEYIVIAPDMLGIQKVNVVGHDLGGGVAQILAVQYPDRVESFVVIDDVTFSNWPLPKVVSLRYPTAPEFEPSPYFIERMIREGVFHQQMVTPEILQAFIAPFDHENGPRELQEASLALEHHQTEDVVPGLQGVRVPATFLYGQYDRHLPPYWGFKLQETVLNSTFKVLPECSHYSMLDNPLLVSQEIAAHMNQMNG